MTANISLVDWQDPPKVARLLENRCLRGPVAVVKAGLFRLCAESLRESGVAGGAGAAGFFVPGRIEVLGKHTDYAGGRSLLAAVERGFCTLAVPRGDRVVCLSDVRGGERCRFALDRDLAVPAGTWFNYPLTVGRRLARNFQNGPLRGADIAFASDLPPASGMSSSSALMVSTFLVLAWANGLADRPEYRANIDGAESPAEYLGCVENGQSYRGLEGDRGVGTFGGSEDHVAMLRCREGLLSQYSYCPVRFEREIALPPGYGLAVASSGVAAEKTGSAMAKYNRASRLAGAVAAAWRSGGGGGEAHMAAILRGGPGAKAKLREILSSPVAGGGEFTAGELTARFEHFVAESEEIIPAAGDALARGDVAEFGRQSDRSQELAEKLLGNQVEETVYLARRARELGAAGASAFGAGFGGSVWALVRRGEDEAFLSRWREDYARRFMHRAAKAEFFLTGAGTGALTIFD